MNRRIIIIIGIICFIAILILVYFFFTTSNSAPNKQDDFANNVQQAISNPIEKVADGFSNLVKNDNYLISYGGNQDTGTFFITVNAEPVIDISKQAEQAFLQKLQIDEMYACTLTVILNVPSALDSSLSEYNFGLSFCPDRIHIEDIQREPVENGRYYDSIESQAPPTNSFR